MWFVITAGRFVDSQLSSGLSGLHLQLPFNPPKPQYAPSLPSAVPPSPAAPLITNPSPSLFFSPQAHMLSPPPPPGRGSG